MEYPKYIRYEGGEILAIGGVLYSQKSELRYDETKYLLSVEFPSPLEIGFSHTGGSREWLINWPSKNASGATKEQYEVFVKQTVCSTVLES